MFGYVRCAKGELKVNEYETYKSVYCSLCKYLGKNYGILSRFTLSYDFTFLSLLNISVGDTCPEYKKSVCAFNPLKKCNYCQCTDKFDFPAAASIITFYYKLLDNAEDNKGIKKAAYKFAKFIFNNAHKKAALKYPQVEKILSDYIEKQKIAEKENTDNIDIAADPTASALSEIFALCSNDEMCKRALGRMGYCVGRYIYLLDAVSDFEKDLKSGNYNVLKFTCKTRREAVKRIKPQLYASVNEAQKAFELVNIKRYKTIIGNAVYLGFEETFLKELKNEKSV